MSSAVQPNGDDDVLDRVQGDDDPGLNIDLLRRRRELVLMSLALVLVLGITGYAAFRFTFVPKPATSELTAIAQATVKEAFPDKVAQFDAPVPSDVVFISDDLYQVSGQALVLTRQGASQAYLFVCALKRSSDGKWRPAKLDLNPL